MAVVVFSPTFQCRTAFFFWMSCQDIYGCMRYLYIYVMLAASKFYLYLTRGEFLSLSRCTFCVATERTFASLTHCIVCVATECSFSNSWMGMVVPVFVFFTTEGFFLEGPPGTFCFSRREGVSPTLFWANARGVELERMNCHTCK